MLIPLVLLLHESRRGVEVLLSCSSIVHMHDDVVEGVMDDDGALL